MMNSMEKYNKLLSDLKDIELEKSALEENEIVKRYLQLKKDITK